ncbi:ComEA family DNA-binding protein [Mycetocola spongiae]|uniref:ComEA family DNA-binding protein n=1 Tax=Mycetocola spongiae TaxID=2859226 RepID=UPI001CF1949F|nr:helix-hairpin-helix domain-containing protein [Mycetocola spongiae]UCR89420.1 helix-hairpin-helix domain-containing protein [Mycetocola spongiae]
MGEDVPTAVGSDRGIGAGVEINTAVDLDTAVGLDAAFGPGAAAGIEGALLAAEPAEVSPGDERVATAGREAPGHLLGRRAREGWSRSDGRSAEDREFLNQALAGLRPWWQRRSVLIAVAVLLVVALLLGMAAARARGIGAPQPLGTVVEGVDGVDSGEPGPDPRPAGGAESSPGARPGGSELIVHIAGAVASPGLYHLPPGARVADALAAAGGPVAEAHLDALNLARPVADGEQVRVPAPGEAAAPGAGPGPGGVSAAGGPGGEATVSLNLASAQQLDTLPRVGPALSARIIEYREKNGPFASLNDLLKVSGIGPRLFEGLAGKITL